MATNTFKTDIFRTEGFNLTPFNLTTMSNTISNNLPMSQNNLNLTPFNMAPFSLQPTTQAAKQLRYKLYQNRKQEEQLLFDYNDPYQINSFADVLLTTFNPNMEHSQILGKGLSDIPLLNIIPNTLDLMRRSLKPISKGKPLIAGMNLLMNLGESVDVLSNPVKALLQGEGLEGMAKAWGGTEEGRINYDWDTGNKLVDLGLEIVSDPFNWISFGSKAVITSPIKSGIKESLEEVITPLIKPGMRRGAQIAAYDDLTDIISKSTKEALLSGRNPTKAINDISRSILRASEGSRTPFRLTSDLTREALNEGLTKASILLKGVAEESLNTNILKGIFGLGKAAGALEKAMVKGTLFTSGVYPLYKLATGVRVLNSSVEKRFMKKTLDTNELAKNGLIRADSTYKLNTIEDLISDTVEIFNSTEELIERWGPDQVNHMAVISIEAQIKDLTKILGDTKLSPRIKLEQMTDLIKTYTNKVDIKNIDDYIDMVKRVDTLVKEGGAKYSYLDSLVKNLEDMKGVISDLHIVENLKAFTSDPSLLARTVEVTEDYIKNHKLLKDATKRLSDISSRVNFSPSKTQEIVNHAMEYAKSKPEYINVTYDNTVNNKAIKEFKKFITTNKLELVVVNDSPKSVAPIIKKVQDLYNLVNRPDIESFITNTDYSMLKALKNDLIEDLSVLRLFDKESYKYVDGVLDQVQKIRIDLMEKAIINMQDFNNHIIFQLEGASLVNKLNTNPTFNKLFQGDPVNAIIDNINNLNDPEISRLFESFDFSESTIETIRYIKETKDSVETYNRLIKRVTSTGYFENPRVAASYISGLSNYGRIPLDSVDSINQVAFGMVNTVQLGTASSSVNFKSSSIDSLLKEYKITIPKELRHTAAGDNIATIKIIEAAEKQDYLGWVLDTETTGLDKRSGIFSQITLSRRDPSNLAKFEHIDLKLSLPERELRANLPNTETLRVFYPDETNPQRLADRFIREYATEYNGRPIFTEVDMLKQLTETLKGLPDFSDIKTFNGDGFDMPYINYRVMVANRLLSEQDQMTDIFRNHIVQDYLRVVRNMEGTYDYLSTSDINKIHNTTLSYLNEIENISSNSLEPTKVVQGINQNLMSKIRSLFNLDYIKQQIAESPDYYNDIVDILDTNWNKVDEAVDNRLTNSLMLRFLNNNGADTLELFNEPIASKELRETIYGMYKNYLEDMLDVDAINESLGQIPLSNKMLSDPDYLEGLIRILKRGETNPKVLEMYDNFRPSNWSQVLYGSTDNIVGVGYKNIRDNIKHVLNLPKTISVDDIKFANDFHRDINRIYDSILDVRPIMQYESQIDNLLYILTRKKIKIGDTSFKIPQFGKLQYINTELPDIKSKFAMLKSTYQSMNNFVNTPNVLPGTVRFNTIERTRELLEAMKIKNPDIFTYLEDTTALKQKLSFDSDYLYLKRTMDNFITPHEALEETLNLATVQANNIDELLGGLSINKELNTIYGLPDIPVDSPTLANIRSPLLKLKEINDLYKNSWVDGKPTAQTLLINNISHNLTDIMSNLNTNKVLRLNDDDLLRYLITNTSNKHFFTLKEISKDVPFDSKVYYNELLARAPKLKEKGIIVDFDKRSKRLFVYLDEDVYSKIGVNKNPGTKVLQPYTFNGEVMETLIFEDLPDEELFSFFSENDHDLVRKLWDVRKELIAYQPELGGTLGIPYFKKTYDEAFELLPNYIKNILKDRPESEFSPYFNGWNLGDVDSLKELFPRMNTDYLTNLNLLTTKITGHSTKALEYIQFVNQSGIGLSDDLLKGLSAKEIKEALDNNKDYIMVYLADSKDYKFGLTVEAVRNITEGNLKEARRLNAKIIPYNIYTSAVENVNKFSYNNKAFEMWHKLVQVYKAGFLNSIGMVFRNTIDSNMKNIIASGEVVGTGGRTARAIDLLNKFDDTMKEIQALDPYKRYRPSVAKEYFQKSGTKLSEAEYNFIYDFLQRNGDVGLVSEASLILKPIRHLNDYVERSVRLSQYLDLYEKGFAQSEIFRQITDTHFNYKIKSRGQNIMELFMPFYTFFSRSLDYFMNLVEHRPEVLRHLTNIYTPVWDFDDQDYYELSRNQSLQYQIVSGNLPVTDNNMTLKLSLSLTDMLYFMSSPIDNLTGRLLPPVQTAFNMLSERQASRMGNTTPGVYDTSVQPAGNFKDTIINNMPYLGPAIQRFTSLGPKYYERSGNPLNLIAPSVFGATKRYSTYQPKKSKRYTKQPYSKKYYPKRYYGKMVYPNHYHRIRKPNYWMWNLYTKRGKPRTNLFNMSGKSRTKYRMKEMWHYKGYSKYRR